MTDWAGLRDAYGSAEQVPALLAAAEEAGSEFGPALDTAWSHLCHQDTVYGARYAAIPLLADMCSRQPVRGLTPGLQLAGSILASTDGPTNLAEVRETYASEIAALHAVAEASLVLAEDDTEFIRPGDARGARRPGHLATAPQLLRRGRGAARMWSVRGRVAPAVRRQPTKDCQLECSRRQTRRHGRRASRGNAGSSTSEPGGSSWARNRGPQPALVLRHVDLSGMCC